MVKKIIMMMIVFQTIFIPISNAFSMDSMINDATIFIQEGSSSSNNVINEDDVKDMVSNIYNILVTIGVGLAVLIGAVLGIKYMTGTIEEQAKIKETLIPYAIGCIVVFGAFGIWKIVISIGGNIF